MLEAQKLLKALINSVLSPHKHHLKASALLISKGNLGSPAGSPVYMLIPWSHDHCMILLFVFVIKTLNFSLFMIKEIFYEISQNFLERFVTSNNKKNKITEKHVRSEEDSHITLQDV